MEVKIVGLGPNFGTRGSKLVEKIILKVKIGGKYDFRGQNCRVRPKFWYFQVKIGGKMILKVKIGGKYDFGGQNWWKK